MQQAQKVKRGWQQTKGYSAPTPTSELQCSGDAATEFGHQKNTVVVIFRPVRLAYQPPASSTFLSEQTSHQQPASSTLLSEQTSTSHQPPANRTSYLWFSVTAADSW
jgi:hypothetical protein